MIFFDGIRASLPFALFIPQGIDGVKQGGLPRGVESKKHTYRAGEEKGQKDPSIEKRTGHRVKVDKVNCPDLSVRVIYCSEFLTRSFLMDDLIEGKPSV
jgi:hypothetical protein